MTRQFFHLGSREESGALMARTFREQPRTGGEDRLKTVSLWEAAKEQGGRERKKQQRFIVFPLFHLLAVLPLANAHQARWQRHLLVFSRRTSLLVPRQNREDRRGELEGQTE